MKGIDTVYLVEDLKGGKLERRFYPREEQKVTDIDAEDAPVEVLGTRKNEVRVHYVEWPPKFDEWNSKKALSTMANFTHCCRQILRWETPPPSLASIFRLLCNFPQNLKLP